MGLPKPIIFISYSHRDEPEHPRDGEVQWLSFVCTYLQPAVKHGVFNLWDDRHMTGGEDWDPEIERNLRQCDIFILLVSAHAMASDYIIDKEIAIIRERQARREPVHFYPLLLTPTPKAGLEKVKEKNLRPRDGKPFSGYSAHDRQQHMSDAADEIAQIAERIVKQKGAAQPGTSAMQLAYVHNASGTEAPILQAGSHSVEFPVTRITDPESEDLEAISDLVADLFDPEVADSYNELQRWVSEIDKNRQLLPEDHDLNDILLAPKSGQRVVGALYAHHYVSRCFVFVSYLAVDETKLDGESRRKGIDSLLSALVRQCSEVDPPWQDIVAEVELVKGRQRNWACCAFARFRQYANRLARNVGESGRFFMWDFDYLQPAIRPEDIGQISDVESVRQRLLFYTRDCRSLTKDDTGHLVLPEPRAIRIFDNLLSCVYGDSFQNSDAYQEYIKDQLNEYRMRLKDGVRLIEHLY